MARSFIMTYFNLSDFTDTSKQRALECGLDLSRWFTPLVLPKYLRGAITEDLYISLDGFIVSQKASGVFLYKITVQSGVPKVWLTINGDSKLVAIKEIIESSLGQTQASKYSDRRLELLSCPLRKSRSNNGSIKRRKA